MNQRPADQQGTPNSKTEGDSKTLTESVDKDGKPLPEDPEAARKSKVEEPKLKKAELTYIPQGPLKSKYHVQVGL